MEESVQEIIKDLGRKLTLTEESLVRISFYKGHSKGYEEATEKAIKTINKLKK
jgi:hypothetical protein